LGDRAADVIVIQAVSVPACGAEAGRLRQAVIAAQEAADLLLFDTIAGGQAGGTGRAFAWELGGQAAGARPFLVAGGLGPHNVSQALAASAAWGIDASSGVETAPGVKDPAALRDLFAAVELGGC
jgi:phosphoribosylanthranilate isomerase